jgi:hypothetical protein
MLLLQPPAHSARGVGSAANIYRRFRPRGRAARTPVGDGDSDGNGSTLLRVELSVDHDWVVFRARALTALRARLQTSP